MAKWQLARQVAREIVEGGAKRINKSVQRVPKSYPVQEAQVALALLNDDWQALESGGLVGSGVIIGATGQTETGVLSIYAPSISDAESAPTGRAHVAQINGRWELLSGGGGASCELYLATLETGWTYQSVANGRSYLTATARLDATGEQVTARSVAPSYYAGTSENYKRLVLWRNTVDDTWWAMNARFYVKPGKISVQAGTTSNNNYVITIEYTE